MEIFGGLSKTAIPSDLNLMTLPTLYDNKIIGLVGGFTITDHG
jgi:hypothetical protein